MDQKNLETLARLKEQLRATPAEMPPKARLTTDDFKQLADTLNVGVQDTPKPEKRARQWIKRLCMSCGTEIFVHIDWKKPSKRCKSCRRSASFWRSKGSPKGGRTEYSVNTVLPGGAPGSGKRR